MSLWFGLTLHRKLFFNSWGMKAVMQKWGVILGFCISSICNAQQTSEYDHCEFSVTTGYNNTLGIFGTKIGYRPGFLKHYMVLNFGIGTTNAQPRCSLGFDVYPLPKNIITPFIGIDYALGVPSNNASDNNNIYSIGYNNYLAPYIALKIRLMYHLSVKIEAGYSFLLNEADISCYTSAEIPYKYKQTVQGGYMLAFDLSFSFDSYSQITTNQGSIPQW